MSAIPANSGNEPSGVHVSNRYHIFAATNLAVVTPPGQTRASAAPSQITLEIDDGSLQLAESSDEGIAVVVISFEDMGDGTGLGKLDPDSPHYPLLDEVVRWGMGPSRPFIKDIVIATHAVMITFISATADEILWLMWMLFRCAGLPTPTHGRE